MKRLIGVLFVLFFINSIYVFAEDFPEGGITPPEMANILISKGYRAEIHNADSDDSDTYIKSTTQGKTFYIYFFDLAKDNRAGSIQYCISFKPDDKINADAVLDWNMHYRYVRMYLSKSNSPYFEMDRDIARGLTRAAMENDFERWDSLVDTIVGFVNKKVN